MSGDTGLKTISENECEILNSLSQIPFSVEWDKAIQDPFSANISLHDWKVDIRLNPDLSSKLGLNKDEICLLLYTLLRHEEGHWKVCPFDEMYHLEVRASVIRAFESSFPENVWSTAERYCAPVINMFEDIIVDRVISDGDSNYKRGTEIILSLLRKIFKDKKDLVFILMLHLRESLLLDKKSKDHDISDMVTAILKTMDGDLTKRALWGNRAEKFAGEIFKLIDLSNMSDPLLQRIQEAMQIIRDKLTSRSIFEARLQDDKDYRAEKVKEYLEEASGGKYSDIGKLLRKKKPIEDDLEALDLFFELNAEKVPIDYSEERQNAYHIYLGQRRLREHETFSPAMIRWKATKIYEKDGETIIDLQKKETPFYIRNAAKEIVPMIPDIAFIIDSSSSMGRLTSGGDKYYVSVTAIYSILNYLKSVDKDRLMNFCVINFSSATWYSGWHDFTMLDVLKRKYILRQQSGGTSLNPRAIEQMMSEAQDLFLAIMITDGEISNNERAIRAVERLIFQGNGFSLIKIGDSGNKFVSGVEAAGGDVHVIHNVSDLSGLMIRKAEEYW